ncbi:MAG: hypothetical protein RMI56_04215 [Sulfolobales archaeon]|nr:hypothetical protein [Sulfolobales archaeon]MDW8082988.1 hypothetical protein [Sulfolobales archaeon]
MYTRKEVKEQFGKVFSVELLVDEACRVLKLIVSGDFFAYPPEVLDSLGRVVSGKHASEIVEAVSSVLDKLTLVGVSRESIVELFRNAVEEVVVKCRRD